MTPILRKALRLCLFVILCLSAAYGARAAEVGDRISLGHYPEEEIEWRVLAVEEDRILIISDKILDAQPYNGEQTDTTWETSTLRDWLNHVFIEDAFTPEERKLICSTLVVNGGNPEYDTFGGTDTDDFIFLLSIEEAADYFESDDERGAEPTEYARERGVFMWEENGMGWWWLRSPGDSVLNAAFVIDFGQIMSEGDFVNHSLYGVRPALWLIF